MNIKVDAAAQGSGCFDHPEKLSFEEAVRAAVQCVTVASRYERIALSEATGRVLARDLKAPSSLPRFDHSTMDGFAVNTRSFPGLAPWEARIESTVAAGSSRNMGSCADGIAVEIYTGAPIPQGFDAVMTRESCARSGDKIRFQIAPKPGMNIRVVGEDVVEGAAATAAGTVVTPHTAALLAGFGLREIEVRQKLRVAYFSTGSELRQPGECLGEAQLFDTNRYMSTAMLAHPWVELTDLGHFVDDLAAITQCLGDASRRRDVVTQDTLIIDTLAAMALGEIGLKTGHLLLRQPEQITHQSGSYPPV